MGVDCGEDGYGECGECGECYRVVYPVFHGDYI